MTLEELKKLAEAAMDIPGFPGYQIDRNGTVWSYLGWRGQPVKTIAPALDQHGYHRVRLVRDGKRFKRTVHQLACLAFYGPKPDNCEVRHLNGIRTDNRIDNLVWGTRSENALDRQRHGTERCIENGRQTRFGARSP